MPEDLKQAKRDTSVWGTRPASPPPGRTHAPLPTTGVDVFRNTPAARWLRRSFGLRRPSGKALSIMAWFMVASGLALIAFGFPNLPRAGSLLVSLGYAWDAARVIAFAGLGLLALFGAIWFWGEITNRHTLEDIGIFMTCAGIAGFLALLGSHILAIHLGDALTLLLWLGSPTLLVGGLNVIPKTRPVAVAPQPPSPGRAYHRKAVTIHGDARSADDWEIDEALRDKSGGFDPMFKD